MKNDEEKTQEIAFELAKAFYDSKDLYESFVDTLGKKEMSTASVAFAIVMLEDIMRTETNGYDNVKEMVFETFSNMKTMGAFERSKSTNACDLN